MRRALLLLCLCAAIACGREDVELIDDRVDASPADAGEIVTPQSKADDGDGDGDGDRDRDRDGNSNSDGYGKHLGQ